MKPSVLMLLSNGFHPDPRVHKEARSLCESGFDVSIVCLDRGCDLPARETIDGIEISRVRAGKVRPGEYLSVAKALALFSSKALVRAYGLNRDRPFDLIHCNDFDTVALGLLLKRLWRIPVVYDLHDLYASFFTNEVLRSLVQRIDDFYYSSMDAVLIVNNEFLSLPRLNGGSATVIMNVPSSEGGRIVSDTGGGLFYAGNLNLLRDMRYAMRIFEKCGFKVELAGDGPLLRDYRSMARSGRITLLGRISSEEVYERTSKCLAVLALYDTRYPNNRLASPNKLFDAMKFGKPAIVSTETVMARIVEETGCGLTVPYGDSEKLAEALEQLKDKESYRRMCENAYAAHRDRYNWEIMAARLTSLYRDLIQEHRE